MTKLCKYCNKPFEFKKGNKQFCSNECFLKHRNERTNELYNTKYKFTDRLKISRQKHYEKNKLKYKEKAAQWYKENREERIKIRRKWELKQYNLTQEQYDEMYQNQKGKCLICSNIDKNGYTLAVDHDHKTNKVRGLLCGSCNRAIGLMKDNIILLQRTIHYLEGRPLQ